MNSHRVGLDKAEFCDGGSTVRMAIDTGGAFACDNYTQPSAELTGLGTCHTHRR